MSLDWWTIAKKTLLSLTIGGLCVGLYCACELDDDSSSNDEEPTHHND